MEALAKVLEQLRKLSDWRFVVLVVLAVMVAALWYGIGKPDPSIANQGDRNVNVIGNNNAITVNQYPASDKTTHDLLKTLLEQNAQLREAFDKASPEEVKRLTEQVERLRQERDQALASNDPLEREIGLALQKNKLEEAYGLYQKQQQQSTEKQAKTHFSQGRLKDLLFDWPQALHHYDQARQLAPDNLAYLEAYAVMAQRQNQHQEAQNSWLQLLRQNTLSAHQRARYLNNLGNLYTNTQRFKEAESTYQEAVTLRRELAHNNPSAYQPDLAASLNNLGNLYVNTQRLQQAESAYHEAITLRRELTRNNPSAYQADLAMSLNNLGNLYANTQHFKEAEAAYKDARNLYRELARNNPSAYQTDLAMSLNNLGNLYANTRRFKEAEGTHQEAHNLYRELALNNPSAYQPDLAMSLNNLAGLYAKTQRFKEAESAYQKALAIYQHWHRLNPQAIAPYLQRVQSNLEALKKRLH